MISRRMMMMVAVAGLVVASVGVRAQGFGGGADLPPGRAILCSLDLSPAQRSELRRIEQSNAGERRAVARQPRTRISS